MPNTSKPIEIKISTVVATAALLREADPTLIDHALKAMTGGAADFFDDDFTILDVAALASASAPNWSALIKIFKSHRLNPIAVRHAPVAWHAKIIAHGLSIDSGVAPAARAAPAANAAKPAAAPAATTMIIDTPVRAGQQIYARGSDLIVMATVNHGAEIIADGSIHIYAPLRGRALAGASGNPDARIFTTSLNAELVSIAGVYRTFEDGLPLALANKPVQIRLSGDRLDVLALEQFTK